MPSTARLRSALADALGLVLPVSCAGCDAPDAALCDQCRAALHPLVIRRRVGDVEVRSALAFDGVAARVLRALKEDGRTGLARALAPALALAAGEADAVIVPVPSSAAAYRRRGYRPVELLARRAGLPPARLLRPARTVGDQRALGRDARAANVAGSLRAHGVSGVPVLVVDDVVTTGATLAEAFRALRAAGADVVGAATVAATPRRAINTELSRDTIREAG